MTLEDTAGFIDLIGLTTLINLASSRDLTVSMSIVGSIELILYRGSLTAGRGYYTQVDSLLV